jgi:hypothetical protein
MYQKKEQIIQFLKKLGINHYSINQDLSVDVAEGVCIWSDIKKFPIQFNVVLGYFVCSNNELSTLEGVPKIVHGDFDCSSNNLGSLKYAPELVKGNFNCSNNRLRHLDFAKTYITDSLICKENPIEHINHLAMNIQGTIVHNACHDVEKIPFLKEHYKWDNERNNYLLILSPKDIQMYSEKYHLEKNINIDVKIPPSKLKI